MIGTQQGALCINCHSNGDKGYQAGLGGLAELGFRRKGLAIPLVFILFLAVLIYLKVRQIEARQQANPS